MSRANQMHRIKLYVPTHTATREAERFRMRWADANEAGIDGRRVPYALAPLAVRLEKLQELVDEREEAVKDSRAQALSEIADVIDTYKHKRDVLGLTQEPLDVVLGDWLDEEGSA